MLPPVFKPIVKMLVPPFAIQASCDVSASEGVVLSVCPCAGPTHTTLPKTSATASVASVRRALIVNAP
jgi:hypothetical protein